MFGEIEDAEAANECYCIEQRMVDPINGFTESINLFQGGITTEAECIQRCKDLKISEHTFTKNEPTEPTDTRFRGQLVFSSNFPKCVFLAIIKAFEHLVNIAVVLFEFIVRPANFLAIVMGSPI